MHSCCLAWFCDLEPIAPQATSQAVLNSPNEPTCHIDSLLPAGIIRQTNPPAISAAIFDAMSLARRRTKPFFT